MSTLLIRSATSQSSSYPIVLTRLGGPRSRSNPHLKLWKYTESNPWPRDQESYMMTPRPTRLSTRYLLSLINFTLFNCRSNSLWMEHPVPSLGLTLPAIYLPAVVLNPLWTSLSHDILFISCKQTYVNLAGFCADVQDGDSQKRHDAQLFVLVGLESGFAEYGTAPLPTLLL